MARAHFVAKARKDNPVVKAGESYWWWKFRYGGKRYSKTRPQRHELTQSAFYSSLWQVEEAFESSINKSQTAEELQAEAESMADELEMILGECQESLDNMPESLQESSASGELLTERIEGLEGWISELQGIDFEPEEGLDEEGKEQWLEDVRDEILSTNPGLG